MPLLDYTVYVDDKSANAALKRLTQNAGDMRKFVWPRVADAIREANKEWFAAEGDGWTPWTDSYKAWRRKHGGGRILNLTGGLETSLTVKGARGQSVTTTATRLRFRSTWPTAHLHQEGRGGMAARPVLDAESDKMNRTLQDAMRKAALDWARDFGKGA